MMDFNGLLPALGLLAFCYALNTFYNKGSYLYPRVVFHIESTAELQFVVLTFFLVFTGVLWYSILGDHWTLLASLFSDLYQILVPEGSAWWLKWVWAGYFGVLVLITPILKTRAAIRRITKKTPLVSLDRAAPTLWACFREYRRQRKARKEQAQRTVSQTFPEDVKIDLEKSISDDTTQITVVDVVEESTQCTVKLREANSTIRRTQARQGITFQWIYLVLIGCYLSNQLVWNANMSDGWGLYCDMLSVSLMYSFPLGWAMSFLVLYEAAVDHQEAQALKKATNEVEALQKASEKGAPLIVITENTDA